MPALPANFLTALVSEVATLKKITTGPNDTVDTDNPVVLACAKIAYTQLCQKVGRPFHKGVRTEYYDEYTGPLELRTHPVDTEQDITVTIEEEAVEEANWAIKKGKLILHDVTANTPGDAAYIDVAITMTSGILTLEENITLYSGMLLQTIGNYHRRDALGLAESEGDRGTSRTPADSGQVLDSAWNVVQSLVYIGNGYSLDGE